MTVQGEDRLRAEKNQALYNPIKNVGEKPQDRRHRCAEVAQTTSMQELGVEYLVSDWSRVRASQSGAGVKA